MTTLTTHCVIPDVSYSNRWEQEYARLLDNLHRAGEILWWQYEPIKLKLARSTFYTPDFMWLDNQGQLWCDEVKGFWRDDARVKIKVAAREHPYLRFRAVQKDKSFGDWKYEEFFD